jgi:hypothetical protein
MAPEQPRHRGTDAYVTSRRERKKVEMLFAHIKRILKLDRLRLRGPSGARDEFHLAATAQNLRKMAMLIPMPAPTPAVRGVVALTIATATGAHDYSKPDFIMVSAQPRPLAAAARRSALASLSRHSSEDGCGAGRCPWSGRYPRRRDRRSSSAVRQREVVVTPSSQTTSPRCKPISWSR